MNGPGLSVKNFWFSRLSLDYQGIPVEYYRLFCPLVFALRPCGLVEFVLCAPRIIHSYRCCANANTIIIINIISRGHSGRVSSRFYRKYYSENVLPRRAF